MEEKQPQRVNKNKIFLISGVAAAILIICVFIFLKKSDPIAPGGQKTQIKDSILVKKNDSLMKPKDSINNNGAEGEEESPYTEYQVIANTVPLSSGKLNFGDKVFVDESKSDADYKTVILQNPFQFPNAAKYRVNTNFFIESYRFDEYKTNFSLPPFSSLYTGVKKLLLNENYSDGNKYNITQNKERAKSCVAFGDFDGDGIRDVAILMDNNEKQISRLLIICSNEVTKQPYIAFAENYSDKVKIHTDMTEYAPPRSNAVIVTSDDISLSIAYDKESQKFKISTSE